MRGEATTARSGSTWRPRGHGAQGRASRTRTSSACVRRRRRRRSTCATRGTAPSSGSTTGRWTSTSSSRVPVEQPTVSASMATALLAYSGIAVKMLVDQRLDAHLHDVHGAVPGDRAWRCPTTIPSKSRTTCSKARWTSSPTTSATPRGPGTCSGRGGLHPRLLQHARRSRGGSRRRPRGPRPPLVPLQPRLGLPRGALESGVETTTTTERLTVGFAGLGRMGTPMALRIADGGCRHRGNRTAERCEPCRRPARTRQRRPGARRTVGRRRHDGRGRRCPPGDPPRRRRAARRSSPECDRRRHEHDRADRRARVRQAVSERGGHWIDAPQSPAARRWPRRASWP